MPRILRCLPYWVCLPWFLAGCSQLNQPSEPLRQQYEQLAQVPQWGTLVDLKSGRQLQAAEFLEVLEDGAPLLLGEVHDNPVHHLIEAWLVRQYPWRSVVLEMVDETRQAPVDRLAAWIAQGNQLRHGRLQQVMQWDEHWPWEQYGVLAEQVMYGPARLVAGNLSRDRVQQLYRATQVADFADRQQQARLKALIMDNHCGQLSSAGLEAMLRVQQARDRYMAQALARSPGPALLIAGRVHADRQTGVPHYTQGPVKVLLLAEEGEHLDISQADYAWYLPVKDDQGQPLRAVATEACPITEA